MKVTGNHNSIRIMIGGDLCPVRSNEALFSDGTASEMFGRLLFDWEEADFRIVNLECPLIATPTPIRKTGPHLAANERAVNGLKKLNIDVVGLANNHVLDHGDEGLRNTIRLCRKNCIKIVGGGVDLYEAQKPLICDIGWLRLGIIAMADLEWSIAEGNSAGANPFSMPGFLSSMRYLRNECTHIIALMHLGKEHYPYPSPNLQELCRCMVEEGVSIVVCQHSHCVGASEYHKDGFICYGQGNLIFDSAKKNVMRSWRTGQLLEVTLTTNFPPAIKAIPYAQSLNGRGIDSLELHEVLEFHNQMKVMGEEIKDLKFVQRKWSEFCKEKHELYFSILAGHGRVRRRLNKLTGFSELMYPDEAIAVLENVVRCEAHREVLQGVLREHRKKLWAAIK